MPTSKKKKSSKKKVSSKKSSKDSSKMEQKRLLKSLVKDLAGEGSEEIIEYLYRKKDVNEFLIAKKMDLTINQVRNILYKLSAEGLVSFIRKKDKRKGWYIYYWTINSEKCLIKLEQSLMKKIKNLQNLLNARETKRYYICNACNIEVNEETALEHGFSCEECAEIYELSSSEKKIRDIKSKITRREKDLETIKKELENIRERKEKKREREERKKNKEEEKKKAERKAERKKKKKVSKKKTKTAKKSSKKKKASKKKTKTAKKSSKKKKASKKKK